jgi:hypothetical protein
MAFDWKKLIAGVAPTLATALGGPLAGAATATVAQAVLGKQDATEDEVSTALAAASPDVLQKIKEADNSFKVRMQELNIDLAKMQYGDIQDARKLYIAKPENTQRHLAYVAVIGFFLVLFIELAIAIHPTWKIDQDTQRTIDVTTGVLFAWVLAVKDFYFGSSQGAVASNKSIRRIAEGNTESAN